MIYCVGPTLSEKPASRCLVYVRPGFYIECMPRHHQPATQTFSFVTISPLIQTNRIGGALRTSNILVGERQSRLGCAGTYTFIPPIGTKKGTTAGVILALPAFGDAVVRVFRWL